MRPPAYVMEPRPRTVTAPKPPPGGLCETCGQLARFLVVTLPDPRWRCSACSRPPEAA